MTCTFTPSRSSAAMYSSLMISSAMVSGPEHEIDSRLRAFFHTESRQLAEPTPPRDSRATMVGMRVLESRKDCAQATARRPERSPVASVTTAVSFK